MAYYLSQSSASLRASLAQDISPGGIGAQLNPITPAENTALIVPTATQYPELDLRRYSGDPTGVTLSTAAINSAIAVSVVAQRPVIVPPGRFIHGRLSTITGHVSFIGSDPLRCLLSLSTGSWPYAGPTSTPIYSSAFDFIATGVGFDQAWTDAFGGHPGAFNDSNSPSTWGGFFLGELTGVGTVRFDNCYFANIYRGFRCANYARVIFHNCFSQTFAAYGQSIIACESCASVAVKTNQLECSRWTANSGAFFGVTATYSYNCFNTLIEANTFIGYQLVAHASTVGNTARVAFIGNTLDTPIADTSATNFYDVNISNNTIWQSGDMGISTDNSQYVTVVGNKIRGCHIGGIAVGGAVSATVTGNSIQDWGQDYPIISTLTLRYASNGGVWLSAISIGFQGTNTGGFEICFTGNTCTMVNLPPVSDTGGPVRAVTLGIIFDVNTNVALAISGSVTGNFVTKNYANLPLCFVRVPSHRFNYSALVGTPISGELFTNGANSFNVIQTTGGTTMQVKKLTGTIPATTVFTGALSGATVTSNAGGTLGLAWHNVVDTGNFDWTTVYNPY